MFTAKITDPQGITHQKAVLLIENANVTVTKNQHFRYHPESNWTELADDAGAGNFESTSLTYSVRFWPSKKLKDDGKKPYLLENISDNDMDFQLVIDKALTIEDLEKFCEKHFQDNVLALYNK